MSIKKKKIIYVLAAVLGVFLFAQLFRQQKNTYQQIPKTDISKVEEVPVKVASILKTSCYDCHSNNTNYPWYQNITPVNYYLAEHINDGKKHLNFSEWENLSTSKKHHALKEILEEIEAKKMPLKSYLLLHQQAKLSATDIETLKNWIDKNLN